MKKELGEDSIPAPKAAPIATPIVSSEEQKKPDTFLGVAPAPVQPESSNFIGFSNVSNAAPSTLNAKKLDVDIGDDDDFFESFDPAPKTQATGLIKTETSANPFAIAASVP